MTTFRLNLIDHAGTISLLAPPHGPKAIVAAIAHGATSSGDALAHASRYDEDWTSKVRAELMRFDEHNVETLSAESLAAITAVDDDPAHTAFRVIDEQTANRSNVPGRLGLIVVNMREKRIIQVQNSYAELRRKDRGRVRKNGRPTPKLFHYELPADWAMLP